MPETFLILLSAGIMLAAGVSDPRAVTLRWLRLAGILSLTFAALAGFFFLQRARYTAPAVVAMPIGIAAVLGQLAFVQIAMRRTQRVLAIIGYFGGGVAGAAMLITILDPRALGSSHAILALGCAITAAAVGLSLMDMLLGHAYLNAAEMTMTPFRRLNLILGVAIAARAMLSFLAAFMLQPLRPIEQFWNLFGLYIGTRWLVGFVVAGVFVWMAHDCIRRRATQSATGILYVAGVLIFLGEIIGLYLMSETGLPL